MTCDGHAFSSLPMCAGLHERMTDEGLRALASAGCGENLKFLFLRSGWLRALPPFPISPFLPLAFLHLSSHSSHSLSFSFLSMSVIFVCLSLSLIFLSCDGFFLGMSHFSSLLPPPLSVNANQI